MASDEKKTTEPAVESTAKKPAPAAAPVAVTVKFEKSHGIYNAGEVATFAASKADWLLQKKIAIKA